MRDKEAQVRGFAVFTALIAVISLAGCTNNAPPTAGAPTQPSQTQQHQTRSPEGLPQVTPQPREISRVGDDLVVNGPVELVVDPLVDQPSRELATKVLRAAGASDVIVREPGPPTQEHAIRVRIGDRRGPGVSEGLKEAGIAHQPMPPAEGYVLAVNSGDKPSVVIGASDSSGIYYGIQTLRQLVTPGRIAGARVADEPSMPLRGTVEGFYGRPWSHDERMDQLAFYGDMKLNTYVYAPKDDPFHRERWRDPYPPDKLGQLSELIRQAGRNHVKFTFALSPGATICYSEPRDWAALIAKMQAMYDAGVRDFSVPLDDISYTKWNCGQDEAQYGRPSQASAGRAQADLVSRVQREFVDTHPGTAALQMVPTEYSDADPTPYKTALRQIDPRVQVMWTGIGVIPRQITVANARTAAATFGRKVLLWDNYPVNDFDASEGRLLVGPYAKRQPGLHTQLTGDVVNPMNQAAASKIVETGAADFSWNDDAFDPQRAWRAAAQYVSGDRFTPTHPGLGSDPAAVDALMVFLDLEHMSPLANGQPWQASAPALAHQIADFRTAWNGGDRRAALARLRGYAQAIAGAPARIRLAADKDFVSDASPWLEATDLWGAAFVSTVDAMRARVDGDEARAKPLFDNAAELARKASEVRTVPGETRPQGPVRVADGVLDVFIQQAPTM